jgi:DNA-binding CsgD family transcriptional regulator
MSALGAALVPGEVLRTLLQSVDRAGLEALPLLRLVPVDPRQVMSLRALVDWEDLVTLVDRLVKDRGQAMVNRIARDMVAGLPGLRLLSGLMLPPRAFYRALFALADRSPLWEVGYDEFSTTGVATFKLEAAARGSAAVFEAMGEMLAVTPRLLNLPDSRVEARAQSHGARYVFELPRGRGLQARVTDAQVAAIVDEFVAATPWGHVHREHSLPTVAVLEERFGLTRAEGRVVRRLVSGRSLNEIARELKVGDETVRTHAKRAMQKTDTHRQAELVALVLRVERGPQHL